jgi:hypothetical protein
MGRVLIERASGPAREAPALQLIEGDLDHDWITQPRDALRQTERGQDRYDVAVFQADLAAAQR